MHSHRDDIVEEKLMLNNKSEFLGKKKYKKILNSNRIIESIGKKSLIFLK